MNKRIKKKKETMMNQWSVALIITLSTPRWKRRKARMKLGKRFKIALIGNSNKNRRTYPTAAMREEIQRFEANVGLTAGDNLPEILFERDIEHPYTHSYFPY